MAAESPNVSSSAVRYVRRSASPVSSATSTEGTSSSNPAAAGRTVIMTQRKDLVRGSPGSSPSRDGVPISSASNAAAICGWVCACILGAMASTFLLVIYFMPTEGVFPVMVQLYQKPEKPTAKRGFLRIYPGYNTTRYSHTISMDPIDTLHNSKGILDILQGYPTHNANEPPPPPYVHCWFNNPNRTNPCFFDRGWLGDLCSNDDAFGYNNSSPYIDPCFIIRIENTGNWMPEPLPLEFIADSWRAEHDPAFLGLGCRAKEGDKSGVTFERHPIKGFSVHYFPVAAFSPDFYLPPAVMIQVKRVPRHTGVTIECWIRTHNEEYLTDNGYAKIKFIEKRQKAVNSPEARGPSTRNGFVSNTRLPEVPSTTNSTASPELTVATTTNNTILPAEPTNSSANATTDEEVHKDLLVS